MYKITAQIEQKHTLLWQTAKNGNQRQVSATRQGFTIVVIKGIKTMSAALDLKAQLRAGGYSAYKALTNLEPNEIDACLGATLTIEEE